MQLAAAVVTGINSDLPGQTIATVTQNVYDTVTGNLLLVPHGPKMLGQYDSQVAYGQRRVLLVWTRLIMLDGASITLDRLEGVYLRVTPRPREPKVRKLLSQDTRERPK